MTDDEMNPAICPSSLEEDGTLDRTMGGDWGEHKWDKDTMTCDECGSEADDETKRKLWGKTDCDGCGKHHDAADIEYLGHQVMRCKLTDKTFKI